VTALLVRGAWRRYATLHTRGRRVTITCDAGSGVCVVAATDDTGGTYRTWREAMAAAAEWVTQTEART